MKERTLSLILLITLAIVVALSLVTVIFGLIENDNIIKCSQSNMTYVHIKSVFYLTDVKYCGSVDQIKNLMVELGRLQNG
jgi:hypothetical protein